MKSPTTKIEGRYDRFSRHQIEQMLVDTQEHNKELRGLMHSMIVDVEAMRCEPPFDILEDGDDDMKTDWFGHFSECHLDDDDFPSAGAKIQWPCVGILVNKMKEAIDYHE